MADLPVLDAAEQRVLGSLLEKEITVPASYPMSINSVRAACNQTSSREPIVDYDEEMVHRTLRSLKDKDLVALTWQGAGSRVVKYVQTFAQRRSMPSDERALLTVLLLRGPPARRSAQDPYRAPAPLLRPRRGGGLPCTHGRW